MESLDPIITGFEILSWKDAFSAGGKALEFSSSFIQDQQAKVFKNSKFFFTVLTQYQVQSRSNL